MMSSFQVTSFIDQPVFVSSGRRSSDEYATFKAVRRHRMELDFEDHLKLAFVWDDQHEFMNAVKGLSPDQDLLPELIHYMYAYDAVNCASALINPDTAPHFPFNLMDTAMGRIPDRVKRYRYTDDRLHLCTTPLHQAAYFEALKLIRLLADLGGSPNTRIDFFYSSDIAMKDALPLNVAMMSFWGFECMKEWTRNKSIFKLITLLCRPSMARDVEIVRLLARKTKELDQEFFRYIKDGKLRELCMLLLAGCRPPSASMLQRIRDIPDQEKILELFQVFNTIGDKLSSYIRIKRSKSVGVDRVASEITSLFEDSGLIAKSEDIPVAHDFQLWNYPVRPTSVSKMISVPRLLSPHVLGGSSFTNRGTSLIQGVRPLHTSSVPRAIQMNQVKNKVIGDLNFRFYKHHAFFTTLRRLGRLA